VRTRPKHKGPLKSTYFQGKSKDGNYPGERYLVDSSAKTVTIHLTKLILGAQTSPSYILAIKFPNENYIVEEKN